MSAWLRAPERVPTVFARGIDAPERERPAGAATPSPAASLAARVKLRLAAAREARLSRGAASW